MNINWPTTDYWLQTAISNSWEHFILLCFLFSLISLDFTSGSWSECDETNDDYTFIMNIKYERKFTVETFFHFFLDFMISVFKISKLTWRQNFLPWINYGPAIKQSWFVMSFIRRPSTIHNPKTHLVSQKMFKWQNIITFGIWNDIVHSHSNHFIYNINDNLPFQTIFVLLFSVSSFFATWNAHIDFTSQNFARMLLLLLSLLLLLL